MQGDVFFLASTQEEQYAKIMKYLEGIYENPHYDGIYFSSPFVTPNHQYPFSMKNFLKSVREIADKNGKKLMISMEGYDPKPDQKINKKKARELIDLVDKLIIANYDCPRGNDGLTIPISPMDWVKQNYEFYCEVYSKAKLTPKLIMVLHLSFRQSLYTVISWPCMESTIPSKARRCWRSYIRRSRLG
jgi:spore germination protein YaaH